MSREERNARRRATYARQRERNEAAAAERAAQQAAQAAARREHEALQRLIEGWGTQEPVVALRAVRGRLERVERRRLEALAERDELVAACRALGMPWAQIAQQLGTSRQALMKRLAAAGHPTSP